jgi:hypothetical protein
MKRWIFLGFFFCSGCGIFVTKENAQYAKISELCMWGNNNFSSGETVKIAFQELARRNVTCAYPDEAYQAPEKPTASSSYSSGITFNPSPASIEMMRIGSELMIQGTPKPLYNPYQQPYQINIEEKNYYYPNLPAQKPVGIIPIYKPN